MIHRAAAWVPGATVIVLEVDDSTKKKAGRKIEGVATYRNGAGSARQEYRTLRGLNFVWGIMRVPLAGWPGHWSSIPIGLSLYLKKAQARKLKWPYRSRSAVALDPLSPVVPPEVRPQPAGYRLGLSGGVGGRRRFSHTSLCPRCDRKSRRA